MRCVHHLVSSRWFVSHVCTNPRFFTTSGTISTRVLQTLIHMKVFRQCPSARGRLSIQFPHVGILANPPVCHHNAWPLLLFFPLLHFPLTHLHPCLCLFLKIHGRPCVRTSRNSCTNPENRCICLYASSSPKLCLSSSSPEFFVIDVRNIHGRVHRSLRPLVAQTCRPKRS